MREVWVEKVRVVGRAHAGGALYLKPGRQLLVAPGLLQAEGLSVHVGDDAFVHDGSVKAVYLLSGEEKRGAALLTVGPLAVGVGAGKGGTSMHLLGPGGWFADEQERLQPGSRLAVLPRVPAKK